MMMVLVLGLPSFALGDRRMMMVLVLVLPSFALGCVCAVGVDWVGRIDRSIDLPVMVGWDIGGSID
jgi:hypothetical protein